MALSEQLEGGRPTTCLSVDVHDQNIADHITHYFGCVEFCNREAFYNGLDIPTKDAISTGLRRVDYLRRVLENSDSDEDKSLVKDLESTYKRWKEEHLENIETITKIKSRESSTRPHEPYEKRALDDYDPDKDLNAYLISFSNGNGISEQPQYARRPRDRLLQGSFPNQKISVHDLLRADESPLRKSDPAPPGESRARYFHLPSNNMKWVQEAVAKYYDEPNPQYDTTYLKAEEPTHSNTLLHRDFWLRQQHGRESSISHARHMRPLCEAVSSEPKPKKEDPARNIVLFMPYLHWDLDRQRKNFSSLIESQVAHHQEILRDEEEKRYKDRREQRQNIRRLGQVSNMRATPEESATPPRSNLGVLAPRRGTNNSYANRGTAADVFENFIRKKLPIFKESRRRQLPRKKYGRLKMKNSLAQLLYDASKLFEVMNNYRDRQLINDYLLGDPPLQPRRTLDQAYYWSLRNTRTRDRDQVVYRSTSARLEDMHHYDPSKETWDCPHHEFRAVHPQETTEDPPTRTRSLRDRVADSQLPEPLRSRLPRISKTSQNDPRLSNSQGRTPEPSTSHHDEEMGPREAPTAEHNHHDHGHTHEPEEPCHRECLGCREAIQKLPRLIMVDQLWMWILDEDTIITCFPRRYGVNRKDLSGIHKGIRTRLANLGSIQIHSACDLALVIIDECCKVFFDRTKTDERQPQVIDIFSEAIGKMSQKQTMYFNHLWHWADELAKASTKRSSWVDLSSLHMALLNITPEGQLQRETKDIIEELRIMIHIIKKQKEVLKRFRRHAEALLDREGTFNSTPYGSPQMSPSRTVLPSLNTDDQSQLEKWRRFNINADRLLGETDERLEELEELHRNAEHVCKDIDQLLSMKQQQASVVQAWQAIRHGEEAVKQGRAIMIFTVITIVFLPLAFMAAIFGMNNNITADNKMLLSKQLKLIFSISVGVIVIVIVVAFSSFIRSLWWCMTHYCINWLMINSGLYRLWLVMPERLRPENLIAWSEKNVHTMKSKVRKQIREEAAMQLEQRLKKEEANSSAALSNPSSQGDGQTANAEGWQNGGVVTGGRSARRERSQTDKRPSHPARQGKVDIGLEAAKN